MKLKVNLEFKSESRYSSRRTDRSILMTTKINGRLCRGDELNCIKRIDLCSELHSIVFSKSEYFIEVD